LDLVNAKIDLEGDNLWVLNSKNFNHASSERRVGVSHGRARRAAITSFSTPCSPDEDKTCLITHSKKQKATRRKRNSDSSSIKLTEAQRWVVETVNTIKVSPRTKTMVVGKIKFPKHDVAPHLVCVEPTQMPFEGVLAARGLSPVLSSENRSGEARVTSRCLRTNHLAYDRKSELVHIMLVKLSGEEIVLPEATVVGRAEEISPSLVAAINADTNPAAERDVRERTHVNTVADETKFRDYVNQVLGHLPKQDREVMEPVLIKCRHVFHLYEDSPFPGTDLVEHMIVTGEARPIRKAPYRIPFALWEEMESPVRDMLH